MNDKDIYFMKRAIARAKAAARVGEVPIGAIIVKDEKIIASGRNMRENKRNALHHAEIIAIDRACKKLDAWRLIGCTLYVTMEPCPMCAGAILNARVARVYYGARDEAFGACGGVMNLYMEDFPNRPALVGGILAEECRSVLSEFFKNLRAAP